MKPRWKRKGGGRLKTSPGERASCLCEGYCVFSHPATHLLGHAPTGPRGFLRKREHFWSLAALLSRFKQPTCNYVLVRLGTELRGVAQLNPYAPPPLLHPLFTACWLRHTREFAGHSWLAKPPFFVATHQFNDTSSGGFVKVTKIMCSKPLQCARKIISERGSA